MRGRPTKINQKKDKNRSRSKSRGKFKCFICHKRDCPERRKRPSNKNKDDGEARVDSHNYNTSEALMVTDNKLNNEWILEFECTFHMCPMKSWFEDLTESEAGMVIMGNVKSCRAKGTCSIRIRMHDVVLEYLKLNESKLSIKYCLENFKSMAPKRRNLSAIKTRLQKFFYNLLAPLRQKIGTNCGAKSPIGCRKRLFRAYWRRGAIWPWEIFQDRGG